MAYTLGASSATDIGVIGSERGAPPAISGGGTMVGTSWNSSVARGFVYNNGTMTDLNTQIIGPNPFSELNVAMAISPNRELHRRRRDYRSFRR